jgi:hypothetical protein
MKFSILKKETREEVNDVVAILRAKEQNRLGYRILAHIDYICKCSVKHHEI